MAGVGGIVLFDAIHLDAIHRRSRSDQLIQLLARFGLIVFPFRQASTTPLAKPRTPKRLPLFCCLSCHLIQSA